MVVLSNYVINDMMHDDKNHCLKPLKPQYYMSIFSITGLILQHCSAQKNNIHVATYSFKSINGASLL